MLELKIPYFINLHEIYIKILFFKTSPPLKIVFNRKIIIVNKLYPLIFRCNQ